MGKSRKEAAAVGTSEVVVAVLASTATNIAVFLPIANMSGILGIIFKAFALTVTSFTLTPMMASLILPEGNGGGKGLMRRISNWFETKNKQAERYYKKMLEFLFVSKKRLLAIMAGSVVLLIISFMFAGRIVPLMDEGDIQIQVEMPLGYNLDETAQALKEINDRLMKYPSVKTILTQQGALSNINQGTNLALMKVKLVDVSKRDKTTEQTVNQMIGDLSDIPNMILGIRAVSSTGGGGSEEPVTFHIKGQDVDQLERYKEEIISKIKTVPGLINLNTSSRSGKPEISIIPDRRKIADAGLTVYDIAMQLRGALTGLVATQYRELGEEYDLRVMVDDASIDTPEEVANLPITAQGRNIKLSQLAI